MLKGAARARPDKNRLEGTQRGEYCLSWTTQYVRYRSLDPLYFTSAPYFPLSSPFCRYRNTAAQCELYCGSAQTQRTFFFAQSGSTTNRYCDFSICASSAERNGRCGKYAGLQLELRFEPDISLFEGESTHRHSSRSILTLPHVLAEGSGPRMKGSDVRKREIPVINII